MVAGHRTPLLKDNLGLSVSRYIYKNRLSTSVLTGQDTRTSENGRLRELNLRVWVKSWEGVPPKPLERTSRKGASTPRKVDKGGPLGRVPFWKRQTKKE